MRLAWIGGFGLLGVFARYAIGLAAGRWFPIDFPAATLLINLSGSFAIGVVYVLGVERAVISPDLRWALMVGLLGGFTTFSAYSLEMMRLLEARRFLVFAFYLTASPLLGLLCCWLGHFLARAFFAGPA